MTDVDSEISIDTNDNEIMARLKRPLFKQSRKTQGASPSDVYSNMDTITSFAVTVNIQPTKHMNKRQWKKYEAADQIKILGRIEARLRKDNPSIVLKEIHYETCPTLKQIHFHALYEMPRIFQTTLEAYYNRVCGSTGEQTKPWRHLTIEPVYDREGWLKYIRKDIK